MKQWGGFFFVEGRGEASFSGDAMKWAIEIAV